MDCATVCPLLSLLRCNLTIPRSFASALCSSLRSLRCPLRRLAFSGDTRGNAAPYSPPGESGVDDYRQERVGFGGSLLSSSSRCDAALFRLLCV